MKRELFSATEIHASAAQVWQILTDFSRYPEWNTFLLRVVGRPAVGERLTVTAKPVGRRPMTFRTRILICEAEHELRWRGVLLIPGLFDGVHGFRLERSAHGVRFHHWERFTGPLVPLLMPRMEPQLRQGFWGMNAALKSRAEAQASGSAAIA